MTVGAVIVHHGDPAPTARAIEAVRNDRSTVDRVVVVVDAGGLDPATAAAADRVVAARDNPGYGAALGRGVAALDGRAEVLVLLNHDVTIDSGFLDAASRLVGESAIAESRVGAAGGPLRLEDGALWYAGGHVRWWSGTVFQSRDPVSATRPREVGFIPAAALAVSLAAWRDVEGFDPWFFLYNEDVDFCLRLRRRGWNLRFDPALSACHVVGGATGSAERSPLYLEHLTRGRLRPFRPTVYRGYLAVVHSAWVAVRAALLLARSGRRAIPRIRALFRGHKAALTDLVSRATRISGR